MKVSTMVVLFAATVFVIVGIIDGCKDTGSGPPPAQGGGVDTIRFSTQIQPIFNGNCLGCHVPGGAGPFSLQSDTSYGSLVNVNQQASPTCSGITKRVLPGNANASVLYLRVSGSTCGDRMPQSGSALPATNINLIRDWINQGARRN